MNNVTMFRCVVVLLILLESIWLLLPWGWSFWGHDYVLSAIGVGSLWKWEVAVVGSYLSSSLFVISYAGILFFLRWGRFLLFASILLAGLMLPFLGVSISSGIQSMVSYVLVLGSGFVLGVSYFSELDEIFSKPTNEEKS